MKQPVPHSYYLSWKTYNQTNEISHHIVTLALIGLAVALVIVKLATR